VVILSSLYQSVANRKYNFWKGIVEQCFTSRITANSEQPIHSFPHFYDDYLPNCIMHCNTSFQQVTINDTYLYWKKWGPHPTSNPLNELLSPPKPPGIDPKSNHSFPLIASSGFVLNRGQTRSSQVLVWQVWRKSWKWHHCHLDLWTWLEFDNCSLKFFWIIVFLIPKKINPLL